MRYNVYLIDIFLFNLLCFNSYIIMIVGFKYVKNRDFFLESIMFKRLVNYDGVLCCVIVDEKLCLV